MSLESTLERIAVSLESIAARYGGELDETPAQPEPERKAADTKANGADDADTTAPGKDDVRQALVNLAQVTGSNDSPRDALKEFGVKTVPQLKESQHADIIRFVEGLISDVASQ